MALLVLCVCACKCGIPPHLRSSSAAYARLYYSVWAWISSWQLYIMTLDTGSAAVAAVRVSVLVMIVCGRAGFSEIFQHLHEASQKLIRINHIQLLESCMMFARPVFGFRAAWDP